MGVGGSRLFFEMEKLSYLTLPIAKSGGRRRGHRKESPQLCFYFNRQCSSGMACLRRRPFPPLAMPPMGASSKIWRRPLNGNFFTFEMKANGKGAHPKVDILTGDGAVNLIMVRLDDVVDDHLKACMQRFWQLWIWPAGAAERKKPPALSSGIIIIVAC